MGNPSLPGVGDALALALFMVAVIGICCFPRYRYTFEGDFLVICRFIFRRVPFGRFRIRLDSIGAAEELPIGTWLLPWFLFYGRAFTLSLVMITLKRPRYGLFRRILVTPDDPTGFAATLAAAAGTEVVTHPKEVRILLDRFSLRVADAFAICVALVLALFIYEIASLPPELQASNSPLDFWLGIPAFVLTLLSFVLSMCSHACRVAVIEEDQVFWVWAVGISFIQPLAWVYYLTMYRPRRVAREEPGTA